jgi:hypothetical protein
MKQWHGRRRAAGLWDRDHGDPVRFGVTCGGTTTSGKRRRRCSARVPRNANKSDITGECRNCARGGNEDRMAVTYKTSKRNTWPAWSGELDDLRRLGAATTRLVDQRRVPLINEFNEKNPEMIEAWGDYHTERFQKNWVALAEFQDGDDEVEGPISEALDELDRRTTSRLRFKATSTATPTVGEALNIRFQRDSPTQAVTLQIESYDQAWARQVLTLLSEEIEKGVPKWAWCRSIPGRAIISVAAALAFFAAVVLITPPSMPSPVRVAIAVIVGLAAQVVAQLHRVIDWFFPPFEITSHGGSTGGRRLAAVATIAASIPIGLIINLMTR